MANDLFSLYDLSRSLRPCPGSSHAWLEKIEQSKNSVDKAEIFYGYLGRTIFSCLEPIIGCFNKTYSRLVPINMEKGIESLNFLMWLCPK